MTISKTTKSSKTTKMKKATMKIVRLHAAAPGRSRPTPRRVKTKTPVADAVVVVADVVMSPSLKRLGRPWRRKPEAMKKTTARAVVAVVADVAAVAAPGKMVAR